MYALPKGRSICGKDLPTRQLKNLLMPASCARPLHYIIKVELACLPLSCFRQNLQRCPRVSELCPNKQPNSLRRCWMECHRQRGPMTMLEISSGKMRKSYRMYSTIGHLGSEPFTWPSFQNQSRRSFDHLGQSIMEPKW